jgi:hypothetical protein
VKRKTEIVSFLVQSMDFEVHVTSHTVGMDGEMTRPMTLAHGCALKFRQFTVGRELDVADHIGSEVRNEISGVGKWVWYDPAHPRDGNRCMSISKNCDARQGEDAWAVGLRRDRTHSCG